MPINSKYILSHKKRSTVLFMLQAITIKYISYFDVDR